MSSKLTGQRALEVEFSSALSRALKFRQRRVRRIVTVSGRGVRGHFPSLKGQAQFESLVEEDTLRVLEVAPSVLELQTQPEVLVLTVGGTPFTYTPDVKVHVRASSIHYLEIKPDRFRRNAKQVERLRLVRDGMREAALRWSIVLESEIRAAGLQDELKALLRLRPVVGKLRRDLDASRWDPLSDAPPDDITATRWCKAQAACDELLARVMGRDPGDYLVEVTK